MIRLFLLQAWPATLGDPIVGGSGRFSRTQALGGVREEVQVAAPPPGGPRGSRIVLTRKVDGSPLRRFELTTRSCPAVARVVAGFAALRPPPLARPARAEPPAPPPLDGGDFTVIVHAGRARGHVDWTGEAGPLARWVDESFDALKPCWRPSDG